MRFHSGQYQFKIPFVIYADFEMILQGLEEETDPDRLSSCTRDVKRHVPSGLCTCTTFAYGEVEDLLRLYRAKDCVEIFCNCIEEEAKRLCHMFPQKPMELLMLEQWREFGRVRECHICLECFKPWDKKVRDHCRYTGKYRGAAHQKCNFWYTIPHYLLIVFHNLGGYNVHLFIRELGKKFDSGSIGVIAENKEKYISFDINVSVDEYETPLGKKKQITRGLQFIDSVKFMSSSLDSLSRNLVGVNGMVCKRCESATELTHIDENYVAHGTCGKCRCASHWKLEILRFYSIISYSVIWMNSSDCCSEGEFIPTNMWMIERSLKRTSSPQLKHSTANSTCPKSGPCSESLERVWDEGSGRLSKSLPEDQCVVVV